MPRRHQNHLLLPTLAASWLLGTAAAWAQGPPSAASAGGMASLDVNVKAACPVGARACPSAAAGRGGAGRGGAGRGGVGRGGAALVAAAIAGGAAQSEEAMLADGGLSLGFDYGTSGARLCAVDVVTREQVDEVVVKWASEADASSPECWTMALDDMLLGMPQGKLYNL